MANANHSRVVRAFYRRNRDEVEEVLRQIRVEENLELANLRAEPVPMEGDEQGE